MQTIEVWYCYKGIYVLLVLKPSVFTSVQTGPEMVCACDISPKDPNLLVTIGKEHIKWWQFFPEDKGIQLKFEADHQVG